MSSGPQTACTSIMACAAIAMSYQAAIANPNAPDCALRQDVLGVSRVVEVDTTGGKRLGRMQYKELAFLKQGEVVLTFDDGPLRRHSLAVLNALESECTKATFYMVGRMAVSDPFMVREIARRGHTIATHTWSHKNLKRQSRARMEKEIELGISAVSAALGKPASPFFRFPYLADPKSGITHLRNRDAAAVSIDVDSKDFRTRSGPVMVARVLSRLKREGKGILLFHDIQRSTARGIKALLRKLKKNGYKVVHMIAKSPVETQPKYDAIALKELAKRKKSWSQRPLSKTAVKWPLSYGGMPDPEPITYIETAVSTTDSDLPFKKSRYIQDDSAGADNTTSPDITGSKTSNHQTSKSRRKRAIRRQNQNGQAVKKKRITRSRAPIDALQKQIFSD